MAVPKLPLWGKNNNPEEWWNVNDFEIISTTYRHEVEGFLKVIAPYFPKGSKTEEMEDYEPRTPPGFSGPHTSIAEPPAPQRVRTLKFREVDATKVPPYFQYH